MSFLKEKIGINGKQPTREEKLAKKLPPWKYNGYNKSDLETLLHCRKSVSCSSSEQEPQKTIFSTEQEPQKTIVSRAD